jgi:hypothetical protein
MCNALCRSLGLRSHPAVVPTAEAQDVAISDRPELTRLLRLASLVGCGDRIRASAISTRVRTTHQRFPAAEVGRTRSPCGNLATRHLGCGSCGSTRAWALAGSAGSAKTLPIKTFLMESSFASLIETTTPRLEGAPLRNAERSLDFRLRRTSGGPSRTGEAPPAVVVASLALPGTPPFAHVLA